MPNSKGKRNTRKKTNFHNQVLFEEILNLISKQKSNNYNQKFLNKLSKKDRANYNRQPNNKHKRIWRREYKKLHQGNSYGPKIRTQRNILNKIKRNNEFIRYLKSSIKSQRKKRGGANFKLLRETETKARNRIGGLPLEEEEKFTGFCASEDEEYRENKNGVYKCVKST